jgi:hypothetical protein
MNETPHYSHLFHCYAPLWLTPSVTFLSIRVTTLCSLPPSAHVAEDSFRPSGLHSSSIIVTSGAVLIVLLLHQSIQTRHASSFNPQTSHIHTSRLGSLCHRFAAQHREYHIPTRADTGCWAALTTLCFTAPSASEGRCEEQPLDNAAFGARFLWIC